MNGGGVLMMVFDLSLKMYTLHITTVLYRQMCSNRFHVAPMQAL